MIKKYWREKKNEAVSTAVIILGSAILFLIRWIWG